MIIYHNFSLHNDGNFHVRYLKKKMSPFAALVLIPLVFAIVLVATRSSQDVNIGTLIRQFDRK